MNFTGMRAEDMHTMTEGSGTSFENATKELPRRLVTILKIKDQE